MGTSSSRPLAGAGAGTGPGGGGGGGAQGPNRGRGRDPGHGGADHHEDSTPTTTTHTREFATHLRTAINKDGTRREYVVPTCCVQIVVLPVAAVGLMPQGIRCGFEQLERQRSPSCRIR